MARRGQNEGSIYKRKDGRWAAVVNLGTEFFNTHKICQGTFQAALDQFGAQRLTELTTLMGYYALLAINANTFEIDLPEARTEAVLPI